MAMSNKATPTPDNLYNEQSRSQGEPVTHHLVIVHRKGWQAVEDWLDIARRMRRVDPSIAVFVVSADIEREDLARRAGERPTLVFSPGPLGKFKPLRGKIYHGQILSKFRQLQRLAQAGVRVPRTTVLRPGLKLDPASWGPYVILKPIEIRGSSHGHGVQLMRTERVRYAAPEDYPEGHPGRRAPMLVQQYIHNGSTVGVYRVLTLFGEPLYCQFTVATRSTVDLNSPDETLEASSVASQSIAAADKQFVFKYEADVAAIARAAYRAVPEAALQGCDVVRDANTGLLYVLELNPGGNTWHFSSDFLAESRASRGPEINRQRLEHLDAFGTAAHVLARVTKEEAV
jgi:hypothetical protein